MTTKELMKKYNIEDNHTIDEYMVVYGDLYNSGELWDLSIKDAKSGAIDLDPIMIYWRIGNRLYETTQYEGYEA